MSRKSPTTWIDMTDLSIWRGHFTGIQRVVYSLAVRFSENSSVSYFMYDQKHQKFYGFDFDNFRTMVESQAHLEADVSASSRAKLIAQELIRRLPPHVRSRITPEVRNRLRGSYLRARAVYVKSRQLIASGRMPPRNEVIFNTEDTVLILGNSWERPKIIDSLWQAKIKSNFKLFQLVYDLIPIYQPQAFNLELFERYCKHIFEVASISDGLMAISESSKRDMQRLCDELHIKNPPIHVIRLGDDIPSTVHTERPVAVRANDRYVLCVGTIEARKNHSLLYYVWKEAHRQGLEMPKLIIVGRVGWYTGDVVHFIQLDPAVRDNIHILENINDRQLAWLYQNCLFTVYPSYYEGWGLPIAESLAFGKLCIASNTSSMPEIAGDLIEYFSPYDSSECLKQVVSFLNSDRLLKKEKEIARSYNPTSWDDTYKQMKKIIG